MVYWLASSLTKTLRVSSNFIESFIHITLCYITERIAEYISKKKGMTGEWCDVIASKLIQQNFTNKFEFHGVPNSYGLEPHQSKKLIKLLNTGKMSFSLVYFVEAVF